MRIRIALPLVAALLGAAACEADEEPFEEGATLEPPEAIEEAPLTDDVGAERLEPETRQVIPADTLQHVDIAGDTAETTR